MILLYSPQRQDRDLLAGGSSLPHSLLASPLTFWESSKEDCKWNHMFTGRLATSHKHKQVAKLLDHGHNTVVGGGGYDILHVVRSALQDIKHPFSGGH